MACYNMYHRVSLNFSTLNHPFYFVCRLPMSHSVIQSLYRGPSIEAVNNFGFYSHIFYGLSLP